MCKNFCKLAFIFYWFLFVRSLFAFFLLTGMGIGGGACGYELPETISL